MANRICLSFTDKELQHCSKRAKNKNKSTYKLILSDITKIFEGVSILEDCTGALCDSKKTVMTLDLPSRTWKIINCIAGQLSMTPSQLVYRIIIAPHLVEIATKGRLVVEVKTPD